MKALGGKVFRKILKSYFVNTHQNAFVMSQNGHCYCCDSQTQFVAFDPWLRDNLFCTKCYSIPRERALLKCIEDFFPEWRSLSLHESSPNLINCTSSQKLRQGSKSYIATQYFQGEELGKIVRGFRNEDLTRQTFADESFDLVISQDVMEHVFAPEKAFAEIARTLKPGGAHIFTVPLINKHKPTEPWAVLSDAGQVTFLHEPEFHGNPIDPDGSPVVTHWGYDILGVIDAAGPTRSEIVYIDDLSLGIRAEYIEVIVSRKI